MNQQKISVVLRNAAEIQQEMPCTLLNGCCEAIKTATKTGRDFRTPAHRFFNALFEPSAEEARADGRFGGHYMAMLGECTFSEEIRSRRVLALLLASEIAKSEGM